MDTLAAACARRGRSSAGRRPLRQHASRVTSAGDRAFPRKRAAAPTGPTRRRKGRRGTGSTGAEHGATSRSSGSTHLPAMAARCSIRGTAIGVCKRFLHLKAALVGVGLPGGPLASCPQPGLRQGRAESRTAATRSTGSHGGQLPRRRPRRDRRHRLGGGPVPHPQGGGRRGRRQGGPRDRKGLDREPAATRRRDAAHIGFSALRGIFEMFA
jgi:hypothetical protein